MATQCIDNVKLFNLIRGHKKVFIIAPREASKGDFIAQFYSLSDYDRVNFMKMPADIREMIRARDQMYHKMGCTTTYLCYPKQHLGEYLHPMLLYARVCYTTEEFSVRKVVDITHNVSMIVMSTVEEGRRDCAFFVENGFHVINAPLLK